MAFLVDAEAYFGNLAAALEQARRSVLIVGWDVHSRVQLLHDRGERGRLATMLDQLAEPRPGLDVRLLVWDCNVLCKVGREPLQTLRLGWQTHPRIRVEFDGKHPVGACHHQKLVVVDEAIAFVGGFDLTARRWDTPAHAPDDARRIDPAGAPYPPFHDVQVALAGRAARALGQLARDRWQRATGERLEAPPSDGDPWPRGLAPDLRRVDVGIARTDPPREGRAAVREIEALYLDAIRSAREAIFIENQYLTSDAIRRALEASLARAEGPEICVIAPLQVRGWLEESVMGPLRSHLLERLREADHADRLRAWYPARQDGSESIIVHSKVCVVDDDFVTLGSANLSNRSMGCDTECNVFIEAAGDREIRRAIRAFRDGLLGEHLGCPGESVTRAVAERGSLHAAVDALRGGCRTLVPLDSDASAWADTLRSALPLIDPERPLAWGELVTGFFER